MSKGYVPKIDVFTAPLPELAEFIIRHLERQGKPSANFDEKGEIEECLYRGKGLAYDDVPVSCGVGCVVSDKFLDNHRNGNDGSYEGQSVVGLLKEEQISAGLLYFLQEVQMIHDEPESWDLENGAFTDSAKYGIRRAADDCAA